MRFKIFLLVGVFLIFVEYYSFQALKTLTNNRTIRLLWWLVTLSVYSYFFYIIFTSPSNQGQTPRIQLAIGAALLFIVPKLLLCVFLFGEDVVRWISKMISWFGNSPTKPIAGRRKFISSLAMGVAALPFVGFLYGMIQGKYNFKVLKYELDFDDLPEAFDGFTITQISDIHSGSFTNREKIQYAVDLVNKQKSDLLLFTGDIVNSKAPEMDPWIDLFGQLQAEYGKYSILGNHDYGDYVTWKTPEDKVKNFDDIKSIHPKIGFDLLLNENRYINKDGQRIALVGVENWGKGFRKSGDLKKATSGLQQDDFKILLSHDPSHWEYKVKDDDFNYHITLSGHTHGLQFGIEIPGLVRWSPAKYAYKQWAGLYKKGERILNVNRGFGYHAFPGRVGIWPEITVITLRKA